MIDDDEGPEPERPDAVRVGRRALALYAVASRASFEWAAPAEAGEGYRAALLDWVATRRLDDELEPAERDLLNASIGTPDERTFVPASWRAEGAAVLAWALGRLVLPEVDRNVGLGPLGEMLYDGRAAGELRLRAAGQITEFEAILYNLNWRVNHHRRNPAPYDLRGMLENYGGLPPDAGVLRYGPDGDLVVGGLPFTAAPADRRAACTSIVLERRRAATWLCGDHPIYSQVAMDT